LKDAVLRAAAESKHAKGGGLVGYLTDINNPELFVPLLAKLLPLQEKERAQTANQPDKPVKPAAYRRTAVAEFRAAPIAQGIPVHQVDEGTRSSNVIDGPFKRQDRDDTDESTVTDPKTQEIFQFFRGLGYSGVLLLGNRYLHYSNPDAVPHYKFGMVGHRDFLFFPPEAIGTTIPLYLSKQFPQTALEF